MKTMSRVVIFALSSFFAVIGVCAQEHAPTLDQCHADRDLWMYQIPKDSTGHEGLRKSFAGINSNALLARQVELTNCMTAIDPMPDVDHTDWGSVNRENFSATVLAHEQHLLDRENWDKSLLSKLAENWWPTSPE
jgi:hypothetical protein